MNWEWWLCFIIDYMNILMVCQTILQRLWIYEWSGFNWWKARENRSLFPHMVLAIFYFSGSVFVLYFPLRCLSFSNNSTSIKLLLTLSFISIGTEFIWDWTKIGYFLGDDTSFLSAKYVGKIVTLWLSVVECFH